MGWRTAASRARRHWFALALTCALVAGLLLGAMGQEPARAEKPAATDPQYRVLEAPPPPEVAIFCETYKGYPGLFRLTRGDTTYLLISWGEKRTGGYSMTLRDIRREGEVLVAEVVLRAPGPGDMVVQVISYPHLLVALPATTAPVAAEFTGGEWVAPGEGLPPGSADFFIEMPLPMSQAGSPLRVSGVTRAGTFRISLEDGHDVLGSTIVRTGGKGWASFAADLAFRAPTNPFGHLIFAVEDPQDGGWIEKMGVPVRFGPPTPSDFPDVDGHWAEQAIRRALQRGFVAGYPDGRFRPDDPVTRAQFIRILTSAFGMLATKGSAGTPFADTAGHWASPYIDAALAAGVLLPEEYPGGRFEPDRPVTRLEMAAHAVRALGKREEAGQPEYREAARGYRDSASIPDQFRGYVGLATRLGITTGLPGSLFGPHQGASRAEATTMVMRALDTREAAGLALEFFRRWADLDLEGMSALMLVPPEKFIPNSDIVFAPFYPKKYPDDLPDFVRASRDLVQQYDPSAWENPVIQESRVDPSASPPAVRVHLRLGQAPYDIWAEMELTDEGMAGWRMHMMDSLPVPSGVPAPPSSFSLERLQPTDVRNLDGTPGVEILGWAFWGEYEGTGPEPPGARGLFSFREGKPHPLWFTREGPAPGWVWTGEGVMGHLTGPHSIDLLLVRRPAYLDGQPTGPEGPRLGLYRLKQPAPDREPATGAGGTLEKVADVQWPQLAPADTAVYYGLMAARPLDDAAGDEIVISAFCTPPTGPAYQIVAVCRLKDTSLEVLGTCRSPAGQSLYLTFAPPGAGTTGGEPAPCRLYVWAQGGQEVTALVPPTGAERAFAPATLPVPHHAVKAAADLDGDGHDEFLVEGPRHRLELLKGDGTGLWETSAYKGAGQAWMGLVDGKVNVVMAEPGADAYRVVRWEGEPPAGGSTAGGRAGMILERVWASPPLGRAHISSLWVADVQGDGRPEILVTSSDSYLAPADHVHAFDLTSGDLLAPE
ncbi:MAG: S-layer homology domain-containing protein [Bacillota bacterium]